VAEAQQDARTGKRAPDYEFRLTRLPYFLSVVGLLAVYIAVLVIALGLGNRGEGALLTFNIVSVIAAVIHFVLAIGRFHDIGYSGWWSLLLCVPIFGIAVWFMIFIAESVSRNPAKSVVTATPAAPH